jgi:UDP-glucuronate decarboxylase
MVAARDCCPRLRSRTSLASPRRATPRRVLGARGHGPAHRGRCRVPGVLPAWLAAADDPALRLIERDVVEPLGGDGPRFDHKHPRCLDGVAYYYRQHPVETMDTNVGGLRLLLDHAVARTGGRAPGCRAAVLLHERDLWRSRSGEHPHTGDYCGLVSCTGPRACYDESKRFGETLCVSFARARDVNVAMARPSNEYGPGLRIDDRRVLPDLARDVLAGRDIVLLSDGSATCTFCYAADAEGYYRVPPPRAAGRALHIGTDRPESSMRSLADRVAALGRQLEGTRGRWSPRCRTTRTI